jgi:ribokinase
MASLAITVIGSINLDHLVEVERLPTPGETVLARRYRRAPGGKGANQALAAARLGSGVRLIGRVGEDPMAEDALSLLRDARVDLSGVMAEPRLPTGAAFVTVDAQAENQIVVAPGANAAFAPEHLPDVLDAPLMLQLELPVPTVEAAVERATGFVALNLAPAAELSDAMLARADLIVANEAESGFYGARVHEGPGLVAITLGGRGARLFRDGRPIAQAQPPVVQVVDTVGAGDAFAAALTVRLLEGAQPDEALRFACYAGALAATKPGAQPSLPSRAAVESLIARDTGPGAFAT